MKQGLKTHHLFLLLITINIIFAAFFGGDFGDSYDENARYEKAVETIASYKREGPIPRIGHKGSIYVVTAKMGGDLIRLLNPDLSVIQAWHYVHFASFILALIAFYSICLNFLDPTEAFLTTALFNTQPLLFGHAFINPKDIPVMALFILTFAAGLKMIKKYSMSPGVTNGAHSQTNLWQELQAEWSTLRVSKKILIPILLLPPSMILVPIVWKKQVQEWIVASINTINPTWITNFMDKVAWILFKGNLKNGITIYTIERLFPNIMVVLIAIGLVYAVGLLLIFLPKSFKSMLGYTSPRQFLSGLSLTFKNPWFYLSGFIFGFSISDSTLGFAAGILVLFYAWLKCRPLILPAAISYLGLGSIVLYASRPELWKNPLSALYLSFSKSSSFTWNGLSLFNGNYFHPKELPIYYLPTMIGLQLTIPALVLIVFGVTLYFIYKNKYQLDRSLFLIFLLWFGVPVLAILLVNPSLYDNFRHFLFIMPPLFLLAGLSIKVLRSLIHSNILAGILALALLFPGIKGIIDLHPYQYIYYNELVGGVSGADRRFLTDYWYTSYRDSIEYLNDIAEPNATILVTGPRHIIRSYAREDLMIIDTDEEHVILPDYLIAGSRDNEDQLLFPDEEIIYAVQRGDAILSVIKKIDR